MIPELLPTENEGQLLSRPSHTSSLRENAGAPCEYSAPAPEFYPALIAKHLSCLTYRQVLLALDLRQLFLRLAQLRFQLQRPRV